jgi:alpha-1,2-mannosyltransferase
MIGPALTGITTSHAPRPVRERGPAARGPGGAAGHEHVTVIIAAATLLALALRIYQLTRPGYLLGVTEYDDGVYFGSAVRLVYGLGPYKDFVLVQPPGIVLLMAPLGLLAKATGTASAFAAARVLTACAGAAAVPLTGWLVRRRGVLAVTLACGLLAVYPSGITAAHTVLLEPWLVLFCLLGAVVAFEGDGLTRRSRRLVWAGVLFGFAVAIKLWAVLPVLALALIAWRTRSRRGLVRYLAGVVAGFGVAVLPFFVLAPGSWWRDVVGAQISRQDVTRVSVWARLQSLAGLSVPKPAPHATVAIAAILFVAFIALCWVAAWLRTRRPPPALEWFGAATALLIFAAFLWPPDYYPHYGWFFAPFLALSVALPASRLLAGARRPVVPVLAIAAAALAAVVGVRQFQQLHALHSGDPTPFVRAHTPAGACVLADIPTVTILSNRFVSGAPHCPALVDPIGTSYALTGGRNGVDGAGRNPQVRATWLAAFAGAQYVWLQCPPSVRRACLTSRRVPWTPTLRRAFSREFKPVPGQRVPSLFVRRQPR